MSNDPDLTAIEKCEHRHCALHFPQFGRFTEEELHKEIRSVIEGEGGHQDYFKANYPWRELTEEYRKMLSMSFLDACKRLMAIRDKPSFIRHELYLDKRGGVAVLKPCCR